MYSAALSLFDANGRALVLGPLNEFAGTVVAADGSSGLGLASGPHGLVEELPKGGTVDTVLTLGKGVVATNMDYGTLLLAAHGRVRISFLGLGRKYGPF